MTIINLGKKIYGCYVRSFIFFEKIVLLMNLKIQVIYLTGCGVNVHGFIFGYYKSNDET